MNNQVNIMESQDVKEYFSPWQIQDKTNQLQESLSTRSKLTKKTNEIIPYMSDKKNRIQQKQSFALNQKQPRLNNPADQPQLPKKSFHKRELKTKSQSIQISSPQKSQYISYFLKPQIIELKIKQSFMPIIDDYFKVKKTIRKKNDSYNVDDLKKLNQDNFDNQKLQDYNRLINIRKFPLISGNIIMNQQKQTNKSISLTKNINQDNNSISLKKNINYDNKFCYNFLKPNKFKKNKHVDKRKLPGIVYMDASYQEQDTFQRKNKTIHQKVRQFENFCKKQMKQTLFIEHLNHDSTRRKIVKSLDRESQKKTNQQPQNKATNKQRQKPANLQSQKPANRLSYKSTNQKLQKTPNQESYKTPNHESYKTPNHQSKKQRNSVSLIACKNQSISCNQSRNQSRAQFIPLNVKQPSSNLSPKSPLINQTIPQAFSSILKEKLQSYLLQPKKNLSLYQSMKQNYKNYQKQVYLFKKPIHLFSKLFQQQNSKIHKQSITINNKQTSFARKSLKLIKIKGGNDGGRISSVEQGNAGVLPL